VSQEAKRSSSWIDQTLHAGLRQSGNVSRIMPAHAGAPRKNRRMRVLSAAQNDIRIRRSAQKKRKREKYTQNKRKEKRFVGGKDLSLASGETIVEVSSGKPEKSRLILFGMRRESALGN